MKPHSLSNRSLVASVFLLFLLVVLAKQVVADLYVSDYDAGKIYRFTADGVQHTFASIDYPLGLAFDAANNLYVVSHEESTIYKIRPNGRQSIFASDDGIDAPRALAFDGAGNLFVTYTFIQSGIAKITPDGTASQFVDHVSSVGIAFDSTGYLFATDFAKRKVLKIAPDGTITGFAHGFYNPTGIAFDSAGNLFVADYGGSIAKITPDGAKTKFASVPYATGLIFDHSGYLFVSAADSFGVGTILQFAPDGTKSIFATGLDPGYFAIPNSQ